MRSPSVSETVLTLLPFLASEGDRGVLSIYTQENPPPDPARVYDPVHQGIVSLPRWSAWS